MRVQTLGQAKTCRSFVSPARGAPPTLTILLLLRWNKSPKLATDLSLRCDSTAMINSTLAARFWSRSICTLRLRHCVRLPPCILIPTCISSAGYRCHLRQFLFYRQGLQYNTMPPSSYLCMVNPPYPPVRPFSSYTARRSFLEPRCGSELKGTIGATTACGITIATERTIVERL
jgi:hypothetical protein